MFVRVFSAPALVVLTVGFLSYSIDCAGSDSASTSRERGNSTANGSEAAAGGAGQSGAAGAHAEGGSRNQTGAAGASDVQTQEPRRGCFIVYIHGKGKDRSPGVVSDEVRRDYWRPNPDKTDGDFVFASSRAIDPAHACTTLVTGYNGTMAFSDSAASGEVAQQIDSFVSEHNIPNGQLILIGHSMGGLVIRWMLNHGVPNSPGYIREFQTVAEKTRYAITIATPHLGAPSADVLFPHPGDNVMTPVCAAVVGHWDDTLRGAANDAARSLQRDNLEYASAPGGSMGDELRHQHIYTIATNGWNSARGIGKDLELSLAWKCMGLDGCNGHCAVVPGDGLVTEESGMAMYERSGSMGNVSWQVGEHVPGPFIDWLHTDQNHNHCRYDDLRRPISDRLRKAQTIDSLGSYIAAYGLELE